MIGCAEIGTVRGGEGGVRGSFFLISEGLRKIRWVLGMADKLRT